MLTYSDITRKFFCTHIRQLLYGENIVESANVDQVDI